MFLLEQYNNLNTILKFRIGEKRVLVHYDKSTLTNKNVNELGQYRSVVYNKNNELVGFSPPKTVPFEIFKEEFPEFPCETSCVEEFIDGTMINVFYDTEWCISTKTNLGANCRFYHDTPTFNHLFYDTLKHCGILLDDLDTLLSYSFVMQHPLNRIVTPVVAPTLYLVAAYVIDRSRTTNIFVNDVDIRELTLPRTIQFPKQFQIESYDQLTFHDWKFKGYMLKHHHVRSKLMNHEYVQVKEMRSNQPKLKYHHLTMRSSPEQLEKFLAYYPEFSDKFTEYGVEIESFTSELYNQYQDCFVKRKGRLSTFPYKFKKHMFELHGLYLTSRVNTSMTVVKKYVTSLHPSVLMHALNCDRKPR